LCEADRDFLYGEGSAGSGTTGWLEQHCTLATGLGRLTEVLISSCPAPHSYAVITRQDARSLGIDPPVRGTGDITDTPTLTVIGVAGRHLTLPVVIPLRHLHLLPQDAREWGVRAGEFVLAAVQSDRSPYQRGAARDLILAGVETRIGPDHPTELHLDVEEADAAGVVDGTLVRILTSPPPAEPDPNAYYPHKRLINERDVLDAIKRRQKIKLVPGMVVTPAAQELGKARNVFD